MDLDTDDSDDGDDEPGDEPSQEEVLTAAKGLRQRADALLKKGIGQEDAAEITELLRRSGEAVKAGAWDDLESINNSLSDLLFYLED